MLPKNVVTWFHIPARDLKRAAAFYSAVLGNEVKVVDFNGVSMGLFPMSGDKTCVGGALVSMPTLAPSKTGTQVFLSCEDSLDAALSRVVSAGGKIVNPKEHIGEPGYFAFIEDTEGNVVGLHGVK